MNVAIILSKIDLIIIIPISHLLIGKKAMVFYAVFLALSNLGNKKSTLTIKLQILVEPHCDSKSVHSAQQDLVLPREKALMEYLC